MSPFVGGRYCNLSARKGRRCIGLLFLIGCSSCTSFDLYSDEGKRRLEAVSRRVDVFDVEISSRGDVVWEGIAKVNRMRGANYSMRGVEASGDRCSPLGAGRESSYQLNFSVGKYGGNAVDPDTYKFSASIDRQELAPDCKPAVSSVGAQKDAIRMRHGQSLRLTGDDGFIVMIVRR